MKKNVHGIDRIIRLLFAAIVAILYFTNVISGTSALVLGILAIIMTITAVSRVCPLYYLFDTSARKNSAQ